MADHRPVELKTCSKCGEQKPREAYYFEKGSPRSSCKTCHKAHIYARREADRDEFNAYMATWREGHRERLAAREKQRRDLQRDEINSARRKRRAEDVAYAERVRSQRSTSNERTRAKVADRNQRYYAANKLKWHTYRSRRDERLKLAYVADVLVDDVIARDEGHCGICGKPLEGPRFHLDHIVPLAAGGTHEPDNVQLAHPSCNQKKGARTNYAPRAA